MRLSIGAFASLVLLAGNSGFAYDAPSPSEQSPSDVQVLRVTTDAVAGNLDIKLFIDQSGDATHLRYTTPSSTEVFDLKLLPTGIVLMKRDRYEVVKLVSTTFHPRSGGELNMIYLKDGLTNSYGTLVMDLDREGEDWILSVNEQAGRRRFANMYMKAKRVLGQIVGISRITLN